MANSGFNAECADTEALLLRNFGGFDYVVAPSGSCVHAIPRYCILERAQGAAAVVSPTRCGNRAHGNASTFNEPFFSAPRDLLSKVDGIEFVTPARLVECCGSGGTFSVFEEAVSAKMGYDKVTNHARADAEYIVSADRSCLMHQQGGAERIGAPIKLIHIAQILKGASA
jgi:L-lactate dehydrogenase complex protein LldE